jgi:Mn2+/Fe2+ NRAMP family transporter
LEKNQRLLISGFIIFSTLIFVLLKQTPGAILIMAGILNGLILPVALAIMLIAVTKKRLFPSYKHPLWMHITGWLVVALMTWMSVIIIQQNIGKM